MNKKGFAPIAIVLIVAAVLIVGGVAYRVGKDSRVTPNGATKEDVVNKPNQTSITVVSPNGGEKWTIGEKVKISWLSNPDIKFVNIRLNIIGNPDGQHFSAGIVSNLPNVGSYEWEVKKLYAEVLGVTDLPESNDYSISIEADGNIYDNSDAPFTISSAKTTEIFKWQPAKVVAISNDGKTVTLDFLAHNPEWMPGNSQDYFLNENPKLRNFTINDSTKAFKCSASVANVPTPASKMILDIKSKNYSAYFDISGDVITVVYEQCLP